MLFIVDLDMTGNNGTTLVAAEAKDSVVLTYVQYNLRGISVENYLIWLV